MFLRALLFEIARLRSVLQCEAKFDGSVLICLQHRARGLPVRSMQTGSKLAYSADITTANSDTTGLTRTGALR
jgi:hypothetical protein